MTHSLAFLLNQLVIKWAYGVYTNKEFLILIKAGRLPVLEKFRVFNELLFAGELLAIAVLKFHGKNNAEWQVLEAHINFLKDLGVNEKNRKLWKIATLTRFKEYERGKNNARMAMIEFEGNGKSLDCSKMDEINLLLPQFEIAELCHRHIGFGKRESQDRLFKLITKNVTHLAVNMHLLVCGNRVSPLTKIKVKTLNFWENLKQN